MDSFVLRRHASWHRWCLLAAAFACLPCAGRAADPVDQLREALALKIETGGAKPDVELATKRNKIIEATIPDLKTIVLLRRAYFLKEWSQDIPIEKPQKVFDLDRYRQEIGDKLTKGIRGAAADPDIVQRLAVAILIAELADKEAADAKNKEKFTRGLTDVARALVKDKEAAVRQAALNALGKITPDPAEAFPLLNEVLRKDEVGPRRLAAYALSDLIKNARVLERQQKLQTVEQALLSAAIGLSDADEPVRGYSLQAISAAARLIADHFSTLDELNDDGKKRTLKPDLQKIFKSIQAVNGPLLEAVEDSRPNIRLAALQALDQLSSARGKVINSLQEITPELRNRRGELLKMYDVPDPLGPIVERDLKAIVRLLREDDTRLRRGAIDFLETLGDQAAPAVSGITEALSDSDRAVRWSAARAIRNLPPKTVDGAAVRALGALLIDPDPDLSAAAAAAIEALGPAAQDAVDWLGFVIANGDADNRNWDTESRVAAMKALVAVGGASAQRAYPQVLSALGDPDVRVRRMATETLGRLGRPTEDSITQQAVAALKRALSDDDAEVRLNASEAILSITVPRKKL